MEKKIEIKKISYSQPIKNNKNMEELWRRKKEKSCVMISYHMSNFFSLWKNINNDGV